MKLKLDSDLGRIMAEAKISFPFMDDFIQWIDTQQTSIKTDELRLWLEGGHWYLEIDEKLFENNKPLALVASVKKKQPNVATTYKKSPDNIRLEKLGYSIGQRAAIKRRMNTGKSFDEAIEWYEKYRKNIVTDVKPEKKDEPSPHEKGWATKRAKATYKEPSSSKKKIASLKIFDDLLYTTEIELGKWVKANNWYLPDDLLRKHPIVENSFVRITYKGKFISAPTVLDHGKGLKLNLNRDVLRKLQGIDNSELLLLEFSKYKRITNRVKVYEANYVNPESVRLVSSDNANKLGNKLYGTKASEPEIPELEIPEPKESVETIPTGTLEDLVGVNTKPDLKVSLSDEIDNLEQLVMPFEEKYVDSSWILHKSQMNAHKIVFKEDVAKRSGLVTGQFLALMPLKTEFIVHASVLTEERTLIVSDHELDILFRNSERFRVVFSKIIAINPKTEFSNIKDGVPVSMVIVPMIEEEDSKLFG